MDMQGAWKSVTIKGRDVSFYEKEGHIRYEYFGRPEDGYRFKICGSVPEVVVDHGSEAIVAFVAEELEVKIKSKRQEIDEQKKKLQNTDIPISIEYKGIFLRGKVICADGHQLEVEIASPCSGRARIFFGYASAVAGRHMLDGLESDGSPKLSACGFEAAQQLLREAYENGRYYERYHRTVDIVNNLGRSEK